MQPTSPHNATVLIAEDDPEVRNYLEIALRCCGYRVETATDGDEALEVLEHQPEIGAVLLDIVMPRRDGLETLKQIRRTNLALPVIMLSGASSPLNIVEAMKSGATDFLGKPVTHSDIGKVLGTALRPRDPEPPAAIPPPSTSIFFGHNAQMRELQSLLPQIGWSEAPALLLGETGTGKEVFARELHALSPRKKRPFLKVNCAALPSELVESELFGYERGAFTGAFQKKPGMFELADTGTIFLDEIGDMDFKLQAKLLQVLQDQQFQRLGGKETVRVDVRIIAATHKDLERAIRENAFREDLYFRLNVINLQLPPLRDRGEDILQIFEFLVARHAPADMPVPGMTPLLRETMLAYNWPGNIREMENVVRKLLVLRDADMVARDLRARMARQRTAQNGLTSNEPLASSNKTILEQVTRAKNDAETAAIVAALDSTQWNRKKAAMLLKLDYKALLYKMKKLGIDDRMAMLPPSKEHVQAKGAAG